MLRCNSLHMRVARDEREAVESKIGLDCRSVTLLGLPARGCVDRAPGVELFTQVLAADTKLVTQDGPVRWYHVVDMPTYMNEDVNLGVAARSPPNGEP